MDSFISIYTLGYNPLLLPLFCCSGCYFYSFGHCELFQLSPICFWHTSSRCVCACPEHSCTLLSYTRWLSSLILCIAWPNTQICHFTKEGSPSYWRMVLGVPGGSDGRESACNTWDLGSIPGLGGFPGGGHVTHSTVLALRIPMDRGAWQATVHGVAKSWTWLSNIKIYI